MEPRLEERLDEILALVPLDEEEREERTDMATRK